MNNLIKTALGLAYILHGTVVTAASITGLLFEENWKNSSATVTRHWQFDKSSWQMSIDIRDTAKISSFSNLKVMKKEAELVNQTKPVLKEEVEFAAVRFIPITLEAASAIDHEKLRNKKLTSEGNMLENIGADTAEQFENKGLSLDLFFLQLKMHSADSL